MDTLKQLTLFFGYSSKRKHILLKHMSSQDQEDLLADSNDDDEDGLIPERKYRGIPVLSDTRWLTRIDSIDCLLKNYLPICEAIEEIRDCSSGQSAHDADSYLNRMMTFEFIASAVICHHVLAYTSPLTVALQQKKCDLFKAHEMAQHLIKSLKGERKTEKFSELWSKVKSIASTLNIVPAKKRTVSRQTARSNPPVGEIEAHYRVSYFFAFLDHAIQHLTTRFPSNLENALLVTHLLPSKVAAITDATIAKLHTEFADILPHQSELKTEINTWKVHMAQSDLGEGKDSLLSTCIEAEKHKSYYPNIHSMLMLLLSLPVGSCSCERSFSSLLRLKTWCRNSMSNERLDALAIGYICRDRNPSR